MKTRLVVALFAVATGFLALTLAAASHAHAQVCIPTCTSNTEPPTTGPPATEATVPVTTAPVATTRTTAKTTTSRGPTTTKSPVTLPPVAPQPTVNTFSDVADSGPNGVIPPVFPIVSGAGFLTAIGILAAGWFRRR